MHAEAAQESDEEQPAEIVPAVERAGEGWVAHFPDGLRSMGGVMHGGAVVAAMAEAAAQSSGRKVSAVTAHLHSGVQEGTAEIAVTELVSGRTSTTARVELSQGRLRASATVLLTPDATPADLPVTVAPQPFRPLPPAPDRALVPPRPERMRVGWAGSLDMIWTGDARPMSGAKEALIHAWLRPRIPVPRTAAGSVMLLDAMVPTLLAIATEPQIVFTIEYTVHVTPAAHRAWAPGQWLYMIQHTVWAVGDLSVDDAELWSDDGELIGTARQTRRTMPAAAAPAARPGA